MDPETELEFLRYFYKAAGDSFGPADLDIYRGIADDFIASTGKELSENYSRRYDEDEE